MSIVLFKSAADRFATMCQPGFVLFAQVRSILLDVRIDGLGNFVVAPALEKLLQRGLDESAARLQEAKPLVANLLSAARAATL